MNKLSIKKGDEVKLLSGKDKNKRGKIIRVLPKYSRIIVEGLNVHFRFSRPKKAGEKGQRMELPGPLNISKVMLICPHCCKPTRVAHEVSDEGNFRRCKKCGKTLN